MSEFPQLEVVKQRKDGNKHGLKIRRKGRYYGVIATVKDQFIEKELYIVKEDGSWNKLAFDAERYEGNLSSEDIRRSAMFTVSDILGQFGL